MSKSDSMRAMREANYAARAAQGTSAPGPAARPAPATAKASSKAPAETPTSAETTPAETPAPAAEALCGHRNMGGRTCTRELGHAAKSHRYS